jgi:hypothetical protein
MTSPLIGPIIEAISPIKEIEDKKRKRDDDDLEYEFEKKKNFFF